MALEKEAILRLRSVFDEKGLSAAQRALGGLERDAKNLRRSLGDVVSSAAWQGAAAAAAGIGAGLAYSAKKAIELETQMVQVRKVVDFKSPEGLKQMTADIVELSTKVPYAAEELAKIAAAAGMAGYAEKDIMKFTEAAATMGTAFNMAADEAGDAMVAFQAGMGLSLDEAIKLGDAINHLSDNLQGVVEPAALVEVVKRIGAIGKASGLASEEIAALGAAFLAPGTAPEVAATSMKNFLKALTIGEAGSKSFHIAFDQIGLKAQDVAKRMQTEALPTMKDVLTRIAALPKEFQAGVITKIFGEESKAAIMPLLTNIKLLDQAFGLVGDKSSFAGSMQKEFNNQMNSTDAQMKIFKNNIDALAISVGNTLLPGINSILGVLKPVLGIVAFLVQKVPGLSVVIVGLGVAFAGLVIALPAINALVTLAGIMSGFSILATLAGWLGALVPALTGIGSIITGSLLPALSGIIPVILGIFTGPVGWIALLIAAGVAIYAFRDKIGHFFSWLGKAWNDYVVSPLRTGWSALVAWLGQAMGPLSQMLSTAWQSVSRLFHSYVVAPLQQLWKGVVTYILQTIQAYAIVWWQSISSTFATHVLQPIKAGWDGLVKWLGNIVGVLQKYLANAWQGVSDTFSRNVSEPIKSLWSSLVNAIQTTWSTTKSWFDSAFKAIGNVFKTTVVEPIRSAFTTLVSSLRNLLNGLFGWLRTIGNNVIARVNNVRRLANLPPIPAFASGGYVQGPTLAWVGEGRDSEYIIPSSKMAAASAAYLAGARGMAVLAGNGIRQFARGGFAQASEVRPASSTSFSRFAGGDLVRQPSQSSSADLQSLVDRLNLASILVVRQEPPAQPGPINITTGPILEFDGARYVTLEDFERGMRDTRRQTLGDMRTAAGRRATGVR
jgi:TP901 family phage tail tape measure protein